MRISKPRRHDNTTASVLSITNAKPRWHDCTNNIVIYYPHIVGKCAARTSFSTEVHGIYISVKAITCLVVRPLLFAIINSQCLHGKFQPAIRRYSLTKDDCTDKICTPLLLFYNLPQSSTETRDQHTFKVQHWSKKIEIPRRLCLSRQYSMLQGTGQMTCEIKRQTHYTLPGW